MSTKPKVLLTNPMHPQVQSELAQHCELVIAPDVSFATLNALVRDVDAIIVRSQLPDDIFEHGLKVKAVVRHGVGLDMIPVARATARKVVVANLPGSNTTSVVEFCLATMLHFRGQLAFIDSQLRSAGWAKARAIANHSTELSGSVCGVVGVGAIGSGVAKAAYALGMTVLGHTRSPGKMPPFVKAVTKEELFSSADVVVLCCPLNEATRGMVNASVIQLMRQNAVLINVSRGPVVDTQAVIEALKEKRIAGAAMDVHDLHPLTGNESVFDCPNLLLTPHVAAITDSSMLAMSNGTKDTLLALLKGERPSNICNPEIFS